MKEPESMKVLKLYNQYRSLFGGEETVVNQLVDIVNSSGGECLLVTRSSRGLDRSFVGKTKAFFSGIYNPFSYRDIEKVIQKFKPDIAHVHNLYPLFSPSVLVAFKRAKIPVIMTVHNHFHTCPTADHLYAGKICEKCLGGKEFHCLIQNCRGNLFESCGYFIRSLVARKMRLFVDNVTAVIALNEFARTRLLKAGFHSDQVHVVPNMTALPETVVNPSRGETAVFSGRMCREKGVDVLIRAAREVSEIPIDLLGDGPTFERHRADAPENMRFFGRVGSKEVAETYRNARFLVVPSLWFEGCPLVISEAMGHGLPVIASRIGGLPEMVDENVNGLLFEPGNAVELAEKMKILWEDGRICTEMGLQARRKAEKEYSATQFAERILSIYEMALASSH